MQAQQADVANTCNCRSNLIGPVCLPSSDVCSLGHEGPRVRVVGQICQQGVHMIGGPGRPCVHYGPIRPTWLACVTVVPVGWSRRSTCTCSGVQRVMVEAADNKASAYFHVTTKMKLMF